MELVANTLDVDVESFLSRPPFCFLAAADADGAPRVSPPWFHWAGGAVRARADEGRSVLGRVEHTPETAVASRTESRARRRRSADGP